jgi:uncharacterized protein YeaO (DUF488 family)
MRAAGGRRLRRGVMFQTKRIFDDPAPSDGYRVLVDRLWPRGVSKERAALDLWLREAAPSTELRRWFGHDPGRWAEFAQRFAAEIERHPALVDELCRIASEHETVTLLYATRDPERNEAVVICLYLRERCPRFDEAAGRR